MYPNGDEYYGHWKNGKRDGKGAMTWLNPSPNKLQEEMAFSNRKYGTTSEPDVADMYDDDIGPVYGALFGALSLIEQLEIEKKRNEKYKAEVCDEKYYGNWKDDKRSGFGIMQYRDCRNLTGNWENDRYKGN